jgi:glycosyltransferase involved in cell wall biosynthesis
MRIIVAHNAYQHRGGEDSVVDSEVELLRSRGHEVEIYSRSNDDIVRISSLSLAYQTMWSNRTVLDLSQRFQSFRPDILHVHNTFPLISPSLYWVAASHRVPVIQTLHNFRLMCLNALYLRNGVVCEDCVGKSTWRGVVRKCYRNSYAASTVLSSMLTLHKGFGTYNRKITRFIALNNFCKEKFVEAGLPRERVFVKPNFVDVPDSVESERNGFLYVGRLSKEKGLDVLARASHEFDGACSVSVVGEGPERDILGACETIRMLGPLPSRDVLALMRRSSALVVPSVWYENFPRTIVEAFACGLPVIASRLGALASIVEEGQTGLLFDPGDSSSLAERMNWAMNHPREMAQMGLLARRRFENEFSAEPNYRRLVEIYHGAIESLI